ncbi:MAG TPA: dipeptide epimerase [Candidatus Limnocylindrales bacterium]|nr:dipeptide epimerase [Candidatus Limnocylindrales bacterium]
MSGSPAAGLRTETLRLPLRDPFRIARDEPADVATTLIVDLEGIETWPDGVGEAYPVAYYGETPATIEVVLPLLLAAVQGLGAVPPGVEGARDWLHAADDAMDAVIGHHGGAKCGLDIALHDLIARRLDVPLYELLGTSPDLPPTDFSIGIDEPDVVAERARRAGHFPALKIKLGGPNDIDTLEAVRAVYGGPIRVDANTGWQPDEGARIVPELVRLGVELIEQPLPAHDLAGLRWLQERSPLPIVADESAVTLRDLPNLVGVVAAVNVKLAKCGGVGPALRMIRRARELGFKVFLGCMEETSVGIAASAALASLVDWVDLDGNLLLAEDPFEGLELDSTCRWQLPASPGLGLRRRVPAA